METAADIKQIAFVGDHLPRRCGIATFTAHICEAIAAEFPVTEAIAPRLDAFEAYLEAQMPATAAARA